MILSKVKHLWLLCVSVILFIFFIPLLFPSSVSATSCEQVQLEGQNAYQFGEQIFYDDPGYARGNGKSAKEKCENYETRSTLPGGNAIRQPTVDGEGEDDESGPQNPDCYDAGIEGMSWVLCPIISNTSKAVDGIDGLLNNWLSVDAEDYDYSSDCYSSHYLINSCLISQNKTENFGSQS